jgi:hypothetical protein
VQREGGPGGRDAELVTIEVANPQRRDLAYTGCKVNKKLGKDASNTELSYT